MCPVRFFPSPLCPILVFSSACPTPPASQKPGEQVVVVVICWGNFAFWHSGNSMTFGATSTKISILGPLTSSFVNPSKRRKPSNTYPSTGRWVRPPYCSMPGTARMVAHVTVIAFSFLFFLLGPVRQHSLFLFHRLAPRGRLRPDDLPGAA